MEARDAHHLCNAVIEMFSTFILTCLIFATSAFAHGVVTSPVPRRAGTQLTNVCGAGPAQVLSNDVTAPIENAVKQVNAATTADCSLFFCRGLQLADNLDLVQTFPAGTIVPMTINIRVRHIGPANVSIVSTKTQALMGPALFSWPVFADPAAAANPPANETSFSVTIPDLGGQCAQLGACSLQWWWFGSQVKQTYESCIDFVQPVAE